MKHFTEIDDVVDFQNLLHQAGEIKKNPFSFKELGRNKSACFIFLNPSLRTRLSAQRAAFNLGLDAVVLDIGSQGWQLEFGTGVKMNSDKAEHIKEAAAVIGSYYEIVAIRAFAKLENREEDYSEKTLNAFLEYCPAKIINMESATAHPLQAFADLITINEYKKVVKPKVVLTWAPHPKALPQAVANSFTRWMQKTEVDLVITHPAGYDLAPNIVGNTKVTHVQEEAFEGADFIYAKNWSSYTDYGKILSQDENWIVNSEKMNLTNNAKFMHCLPVRRNMIVSDEVIDSKDSIVIEQAKNRIVSIQTVMKIMLETGK